ncbi:MAG: transposase [Actinomycetota bacterium]|nr:transposase [Actinomycetota bacterium]
MDEDIDFEAAAEHIWQGHRILMDWVREACSDDDRVILDPDPASRSGQSLRIVGFSASFGHPVTVVGFRRRTHIEITSAWRSNPRDQRIYRERQGNDGR